MPEHREANWYYSVCRNYASFDASLVPTFVSYTAEYDDAAVLAGELRRAFAFLRANGDRRYSAASLMKLLTLADTCDQAASSGSRASANDCPKVVVAEVPFSFDEETEVKTGGAVAITVVLPDGRVLLAVNQHKRRVGLGRAMLRFVNDYAHHNPTLWVHRDNAPGMQFAIAGGMAPRRMNSAGALLFSQHDVMEEESDAVGYMDDYDLDTRLQQAERREQALRPRRRPTRALYADAPEMPVERPRTLEICDDPDCESCSRPSIAAMPDRAVVPARAFYETDDDGVRDMEF